MSPRATEESGIKLLTEIHLPVAHVSAKLSGGHVSGLDWQRFSNEKMKEHTTKVKHMKKRT